MLEFLQALLFWVHELNLLILCYWSFALFIGLLQTRKPTLLWSFIWKCFFFVRELRVIIATISILRALEAINYIRVFFLLARLRAIFETFPIDLKIHAFHCLLLYSWGFQAVLTAKIYIFWIILFFLLFLNIFSPLCSCAGKIRFRLLMRIIYRNYLLLLIDSGSIFLNLLLRNCRLNNFIREQTVKNI